MAESPHGVFMSRDQQTTIATVQKPGNGEENLSRGTLGIPCSFRRASHSSSFPGYFYGKTPSILSIFVRLPFSQSPFRKFVTPIPPLHCSVHAAATCLLSVPRQPRIKTSIQSSHHYLTLRQQRVLSERRLATACDTLGPSVDSASR